MAAVVNRFLWQNFIQLSGTNITVSSEQVNFPKIWLRDQLRSKRWRTKIGWTIVAGFNDTIDITEGVSGDASATLTPGTYATGDLMAAEIQTQLNAAATDNIWTCTYDSSTNKFTIGHDATETGGIEWLNGTNAGTSAGLDLGYDVSADDTGSDSYAADNVSYQSRHWVKFDLVSTLEIKSAVVFDSNVLSSAVVTAQAHATDAWTSPIFEQVLTAGNSLFAKQFAGTSLRWWRFVIDDVQNPDGYVQLGIPFLGSYTQPNLGFFMAHAQERQELSEIAVADQGSHYQHERGTRRIWQVAWPGISSADKTNFETIANFVKVGRSFFFSLDANTDETDLVYVIMSNGFSFESIQGDRWATSIELMEAI